MSKKEKALRERYGIEGERAKDMDEERFKIVKAMLDDFPKLRERVKKYLLKGGETSFPK